MKNKSLRYLLTAAFLISLFGVADAMSIRITAPAQQPIAPLRDFYVTGDIDRTGAPVSFDVSVKLFDAAGNLIRIAKSPGVTDAGVTGTNAVSMDYPNHGYWFDSVAGSRDLLGKNPPPDLIFDPTDASSFYKQEYKVAVTDKTFGALIFGGVSKSFDVDYAALARSGNIGAGSYTIVASALSGGVVLASDDKKLTVAVVQDKMLTRFSPAAHTQAYTAFADARGYRLYMDYFPGYWPLDAKTKYEIPARWRQNDSLEYDGGNVHTILYNIDNKRCATQKVEIGYLVKRGDIYEERLHFYVYDIGEPYVWSGGTKLSGKLKEVDKEKKFVLLRAETREPGISTEDNVCYVYDMSKTVMPIEGGVIRAKPGTTLSLFGATMPQAANVTVGSVLSDDVMTYNVDNLIETVRYELYDGTQLIARAEKSVGLDRWLSPPSETNKWPEYRSVYEYKHDFIIPADMAGKRLTMSMAAYASNDKVTPVALRQLDINVDGASSSGGCNASVPSGLCVAVLLLGFMKKFAEK